jgi:hypothetical protein
VTRGSRRRSDKLQQWYTIYFWCTLAREVPTQRPRYNLTDAGELQAALDVAARRWPGVPRRELLDRLIAAGCTRAEYELGAATARRERQRAFLAAAPALVRSAGSVRSAAETHR